jgi:3-deoxy-D-manno-octulosonic-acid transferase
VYPLADLVFVGGSLIAHGGQSILEPAACGKAIITGPFTHNFADAVRVFLLGNALIQLPAGSEAEMVAHLAAEFDSLLKDETRRRQLGERALIVIRNNQGATRVTVDALKKLIGV